MVLAYQAYRTHLTLPNKSIIPYCILTVGEVPIMDQSPMRRVREDAYLGERL